MKKSGILKRDISALVARVGHYDLLVIADAGFPIPAGVPCVDISVRPDQPIVLDILHVIIGELCVESATVAQEALAVTPSRSADIAQAIGGLPVEVIPHVDFKTRSAAAIGVIRTGECLPYANVALVGGVTY